MWDKNDWLYEGQHGFRPGYSCESQIITVCQNIADCLDNGDRIDAIIVDFSKAFDLVPRGQLLVKIANSGVDSRVVVWIREFLEEWVVVNAMRINPSKSKAVRFMRARSMDPLNYSLMDTLILEASSCKYLGIILRSDLSWVDQVNYT